MLKKNKPFIEKRIDLVSFKERIEYEFKYLKNYVVDISKVISEKGNDLERIMISDIDSRPDEADMLIDLFEKELSKLKSYFFHSSIVLIYTLLESSLSNLSGEIKISTNNKLGLQDLSDNNLIRKSIRYIELTCDIYLRDEKKLYDRICDFQKLRNKIVHNNSRVIGKTLEDLKSNAKVLKSNFPEIDINNETWDFHITDDDLIIELVGVVERFLAIAIGKVNSQVFIVEE